MNNKLLSLGMLLVLMLASLGKTRLITRLPFWSPWGMKALSLLDLKLNSSEF